MNLICKRLPGIALAFLLSAPGAAETPPSEPVPIQDNSFLIEEAYNQEAGVVQTILTFTRVVETGNWISSLTQEWPVPDQRNQASATIQLLGLSGSTGAARGFGDFQLSYRRQIAGIGGGDVAFAPRFTLVLPSGSSKRGLGSGGVGAQIGLPLSIALSDRFVAHTNAGGTFLIDAKSPDGSRANLWSASVGQSVVWLAHPNLNLLVEALAARNEIFAEDGSLTPRSEALISPGIRAAVNLPGRLQVVPGISVPIGVGPSAGRNAIFCYLSAELPVF